MFGSNCYFNRDKSCIFFSFLLPRYDYRNDKFVIICVANSMKRSPKWDSGSHSAVPGCTQAHCLRFRHASNPHRIRKLSCCVQEKPPSSHILSQMSPEVQSNFISRFHLSGYWPYGGGRSCLREVASECFHFAPSHPFLLTHF